MNDAQQIFAVFYAIFFGTMLQAVSARRTLREAKKVGEKNKYLDKTDVKNASLNLFDTPNAWAIGFSKNNKPLLRVFLSITILNGLPAFVFAIVFIQLHQIENNLGVLDILTIVWISLAPHWIYRVFYAILTIKESAWIYIESKSIKESKYADFDIAALAMLWEDRNQFTAHRNPYFHIAFPLFVYLPLAILSFVYLLRENINLCLFCVGVTISITLFIVGIILFLFQVKEK